MDLIEKLKISNINVEEAIAGIGGQRNRYINICNNFPEDPNYQRFQSDVKLHDYESALIHIHTLKGVAANLGFAQMELLCNAIMVQLRSDDRFGLEDKISELGMEYQKIISILQAGKD